MRYYLKIEDFEFPNVSEMEITGVYRKESIQQNLAGGYLIDRAGTEKVKINTKLNLLTSEEFYKLRMARERISNAVTYERGGVKFTKQMIVREFEEPTPLKINPREIHPDLGGGIDHDYYYLTANITLEEI